MYEDIWPDLVRSVTVDETQKGHKLRISGGTNGLWKHSEKFLRQGINGRWKEVLREDRISRHVEVINRLMEPGVAKWLNHDGIYVDPKSL